MPFYHVPCSMTALIWCCLCGLGLDDFQNRELNQLLLFKSYQTHGILTRENIVKSRINATIPYTKNAQWPSVCHFVSNMYAEFRLLCLRHHDPGSLHVPIPSLIKMKDPVVTRKKIAKLQAWVCSGEKGVNCSQKDESVSWNSHSGQ